MPDFEKMTLDEITAYKLDLKNQVDALHEEARAAAVVQNKLILNEHTESARASMQAWADKNGKTLEEAVEYWEGRIETDPISGNQSTGRWVQSLLLQGKPGRVRF